ncbi:ankyrin repeat-containing domain protein [Trichoderma sp. SZMC 28014]
MDSVDPVDRRRAQNRMAQRRFRKRYQKKLNQSIAFQTEASFASVPALDSYSTETSGAMVPHYLSLQPEILPHTVKEPENSLSPNSIDTLLIPDSIFSPVLDHTDLSDTSASSVDLESRGLLLGSESLAPSRTQSAASLQGASWESPLHIAAQKGYDGIVRLLLEHGADCNEKDSDGLTPLAHAIRGDNEAVVHLLLSHGARLDHTEGPGCSVFHCAVIHRREALLRLFASFCGADLALLDAFDLEGMTPLQLAVATNFEAGVRILLHHGASVHHRARKARQLAPFLL